MVKKSYEFDSGHHNPIIRSNYDPYFTRGATHHTFPSHRTQACSSDSMNSWGRIILKIKMGTLKILVGLKPHNFELNIGKVREILSDPAHKSFIFSVCGVT